MVEVIGQPPMLLDPPPSSLTKRQGQMCYCQTATESNCHHPSIYRHPDPLAKPAASRGISQAGKPRMLLK